MNGRLWVFGGLLLLQAYKSYTTQSPKDTGNSVLIDMGAALKSLAGGNLTTSQAGRDAIAQREGVVYQVYADVAGYLTAGVGHLLRKADGSFQIGDAVSASQVSAWFNADVAHAENTVNFYVTVPLNQNQFDALVSMCFNLGSAMFKNSDGSNTRLLAYLNAGQYDQAAAEMLRWNHAGGVVVAGLTVRRAQEQMQFMA